MEVTSDNFWKALPSILSAIDDASFVAIDGEFTGLSAFKGISAFDTIEVSRTFPNYFPGRPVNTYVNCLKFWPVSGTLWKGAAERAPIPARAVRTLHFSLR